LASSVPTEPAPLPPDTAPARPDVFVSYSRRDKAFVEQTLLPSLTGQGKDAWIDVEDIPPGVLSPGVAFSPGGRRAAVTSSHGPVPVWDLRAAKPQRVLLPQPSSRARS
jgi:hypothetical protein